jgi:hypothetical protein
MLIYQIWFGVNRHLIHTGPTWLELFLYKYTKNI